MVDTAAKPGGVEATALEGDSDTDGKETRALGEGSRVLYLKRRERGQETAEAT